ncbi:MAG: hypothetical protein KC466_11905, partial [Myxococcales bacterium]|nr:hypothetical protein [Myxococcales bacterium]
MLLLAPLLTARYPTSTPTAPTPPRDTATGDALQGLTFYEEWDGQTAYPLSRGDYVAVSPYGKQPNALVDVCCAPDETVGPDCALRVDETGDVCPASKTEHTIKGWEDGSFISYDGATLYYAYTQYDLAWYAGCDVPCFSNCVIIGCAPPGACDTETALNAVIDECTWGCEAHCGRPVHGPPFDNDDLYAELYETEINEAPDPDVWAEKPAAQTANPDAAAAWGAKGASVNHDETEMAFGRFVMDTYDSVDFYHVDIFLSTLSSGDWTAGTVVPAPSSGAPVNTVCNEENPHIVEDSDGTRLYFESTRNPALSSWTDPNQVCSELYRDIWVAKRTGSTWSAAVVVDLPDIYFLDGIGSAARKAPFVTAKDPDEPMNDPRGRWIYWIGTEGECYETVNSAKVPTPGCIYRAFQSSDLDYDDPWTGLGTSGRSEIIAKPRAFDAAWLDEISILTDVSLTADGQWLYFTYAGLDSWPPDVEPAVDTTAISELGDDDDGIDFPNGKWGYPTALAEAANYDDGTGDTSGWEDSTNISMDGRTLYFAYSAWIIGQALWSQPGNLANTTEFVEPWVLYNDGVRRPDQDSSITNAKAGLSIYEATINASTGEWDVVFSKANYANYCEPVSTCGGTCENPCEFATDTCINYRPGTTDGTETGCLTPDHNGQSEGAVTVSVDASGVRHMVFVRYGDFRAGASGKPRMYVSTDTCGSGGTGSGTDWCIPSLFDDVTIDDATASEALKLCRDNDPHLTNHATSVYFDSNRGA